MTKSRDLANSVNSKSIPGSRLFDGAVSSNQLATDAVDAENIKDGAVETEKIAPLAVDGAKIAEDAVNSSKIEDGSIEDVDLALNSVSDAAVSSISSSKINYTFDGPVGGTNFSSYSPVERTLLSKLSDAVSVKDFGAVGDGRDDSPAFQAAIDYVVQNNIGVLHIPFSKGERYNLHSTIIVHPMNLTLLGDASDSNAPNSSTRGYATGYIYSTTTGGHTLFNYGNDLGGAGSVRFIGLSFYSPYYAYSSDAQVAVKFTDQSNGPARSVNIRDCVGYSFKYLFHFDTGGTGNLAPSFVDIQGCNFRNGRYAVYVEPGTKIIGLRMVSNQSEGGANLFGACQCYYDIRDNLLEGQANPLTVSGTLVGHFMIDGNYFEANAGDYLFSVRASNPSSPLTLGFFYGAAQLKSLDYTLIPAAAEFWSIDVTNRAGGSARMITLDSSEIGPNCRGFSSGYKMALTYPTPNLPYNPPINRFQQVRTDAVAKTILKAEEFVGVTSYAGAQVSTSMGSDGPIMTPHGISTTARFMTSGFFFPYFSGLSINAGDIVIASALVKYTDTNTSSGFATMQVWGGLSAYNYKTGIFAGAFRTSPAFNNEWKLLTLSFKVPAGAPSHTSARIYLWPYGSGPSGVTGAGCWVAGMGIYSYTPPALDQTIPSTMRPVIHPIYPVL